MDRSEIAIIIPAYNEEKTIGRVVSQVLPFGKVIVVDDASGDKTKTFAEENGALVVSHDQNKGYDEALNTGFAIANQKGCSHAITIDADGQHDPALIAMYIELLKSYDMVIGIRSQIARISERLFSLFTNLFFGIKDPLCGMKGYNMKIFNDLGHFDSYRSTGTEMAIYAAKNKYSYTQVPIPVSARAGKSKFGGSWQGNLKIIRSMLNAIGKH